MTQKTALLLAVLLTLACGALLAAAPQTASAPASPALAAILSGAAAEAQPAAITQCEPPTRFVCVNKQCQCGVTCGSRGVKSFTCNSTTGASSCVCN